MTEQQNTDIKNLLLSDMTITAKDIMMNYIFISSKLQSDYKDVRDLDLDVSNQHIKVEKIADIKNVLAKDRNELIAICRNLTLTDDSITSLDKLRSAYVSSSSWSFPAIVDFDRDGRSFATYKSDLIAELQPQD